MVTMKYLQEAAMKFPSLWNFFFFLVKYIPSSEKHGEREERRWAGMVFTPSQLWAEAVQCRLLAAAASPSSSSSFSLPARLLTAAWLWNHCSKKTEMLPIPTVCGVGKPLTCSSACLRGSLEVWQLPAGPAWGFQRDGIL